MGVQAQEAEAVGLGHLPDAESAREAQLLESWKAYKKGFHEGVALFNDKPKKGIAFMQVGIGPSLCAGL